MLPCDLLLGNPRPSIVSAAVACDRQLAAPPAKFATVNTRGLLYTKRRNGSRECGQHSGTTVPLRDEVKSREDQQRAVLDRLVALVGAYSLLVGLTAYFSLKSAREEAQSQIGLSGTQLTNHLVSTSDQLKLLQAAAKEQLEQNRKDWDEFRTRIWAELPDMRAMQEGLRSLLFDLEQIIPAESNWNDERSYDSLTEPQRQEILISELTIAALPTLISRDASGNLQSLSRLYRALARFYFGRYKAEKATQDSGRADAYLTRSLRIDPEHAGSYRLRGAIYLAQQRLIVSPGSNLSIQSTALLLQAEQNLRMALEKDKNDLGAHYNLALCLARQQRLSDAVALVREALFRLNQFPIAQQRKYSDSLVINQACDLNSIAKATIDSQQQSQLCDEAERTIVDGLNLLRKDRDTRPIHALELSVERELKIGGDLYDFNDERKQRILAALTPQPAP